MTLIASPHAIDVHAAFDADTALKMIVTAVNEWQTVVATEQTKRSGIATEERRWLAAIDADRVALLTYLDRTFDERAENFRQLFARLDQALTADAAQVTDLLGAITTLALKSPFHDLKDITTVTANLNDPNFPW